MLFYIKSPSMVASRLTSSVAQQCLRLRLSPSFHSAGLSMLAGLGLSYLLVARWLQEGVNALSLVPLCKSEETLASCFPADFPSNHTSTCLNQSLWGEPDHHHGFRPIKIHLLGLRQDQPPPVQKAWEGKHIPVSNPGSIRKEKMEEWSLARHLTMSITDLVHYVYFQNNLLLTYIKIGFLIHFE